MNSYKSDKLCLLCSYRTIEWKQYGKTKDGILNTRTFQDTNHGLTCTKCNQFICIECINLVLPVMIKDKSKFVNTQFVDTLEQVSGMKYSSVNTPPGFVGHCCLIKDSVPKFVPPSQNVSKSKLQDSPLSGCIHFPEFALFIDSPFDCMDIHAVGAEYDMINVVSNKRKNNISGDNKFKKNQYLPARWHTVIPHQFAMKHASTSPRPNGPIPKDWKYTKLRKIKIKSPHNNNNIEKYDILVIHINVKHEFDADRKGTNNPSLAELERGYLFSGTGRRVKRFVPDITLIIGSDNESKYGSILLCRFHKFQANLTTTEKTQLLSTAWNALDNRKHECRRTGGSSGIITTESASNIRKLMSISGSAPRCGLGTIWIQGTHTWFLYYVGTLEGVVKTCKYTNPVPGGSFRLLRNEPILSLSFLKMFISTKPLTAAIVVAIKERLGILVTPQAVNAELKNMEETRLILESMKDESCPLPLDLNAPTDLKKSYQLKEDGYYSVYNQNFIKYTLVLHPVGFHRDTFADGIPSLENKVGFKIITSAVPFFKSVSEFPYGRGGGSEQEPFVFAILDWSCGQRSKRRVWTDPANANLLNAPNNYPANQALTLDIWDGFLTRNGANVHVPNGVNVDN